MRILIVVPSQNRISGNWVTARRFRLGLEAHGHRVALLDTPLQPVEFFRQQLLDFSPDVTLLLHAYRSGKPWLIATGDLGLPCVVLLTGTDVNCGLDDPQQSEVIRTLLHRAKYVILQNHLIAARLAASHPELTVNLRILRPGITLGTAPYDLRSTHALAEQKTLFLCPAGIRPVKGSLDLVKKFDQVAAGSPDCHLAFCGPILDEDYGRHFLAAIESRPWSSYLGTIPVDAMANAMRGADVILNNSQTEGISNTLLEAASLGMPILASNIPGNAAVVRHDINGLLYDEEVEFVRFARRLNNQDDRWQLSCPDPQRYDPDSETAELASILLGAIGFPS